MSQQLEILDAKLAFMQVVYIIRSVWRVLTHQAGQRTCREAYCPQGTG